ncbi:hypothetical protein C8A03DRAFT_18828 [Achaetomium macrosporum]|uniref:Uncharacterized protein n=1 Tax=Achaetomium macrosporum TaxID=79813 RepID=A0AAN7C2K8_9PEZI|nr:hypothetical protein C8A03DRAFT_18828 [Achaetomium macrosporum]
MNPTRSRQAWAEQSTSLITPTPYHNEGNVPLERHEHHGTPDLSSKAAKQWISLPLRSWSIYLFIIVTISLIIAIIVLLIISLRDNGFATVGSALSAYGATWNLRLLWTAFPSLVFTCLGLHWGAIASAAADREPFVGLNRPDGGPAKETVLLDYRATIPLKKWWAAFRNRHWVVGSALLAALVFSVLSPLAAALFVATAALFDQETPIMFNSTFDQAAMNSSMDIRPVLDAVTATLIYGASDLPWTDHEHAFRPFYSAFEVAGEPPPVNATSLTARTVAHSAYLNCAVLEPGSGYEITVKSQSSSPDLVASLVMTSTDRGCPIRQEFTVADAQKVYFTTSAETSCSAEALYSRLVFTYGHFSASGPPFLSNVSVVSCAVGYRSTDGDLSVTVPSPGSGRSNPEGTKAAGGGGKWEILRFRPAGEPRDSREDAYGFWRIYEQNLFQSQAFTADTTWSTTDFGTVILYRALQRQGDGARSTDNTTVLRGNVLAESISDVFTSTYLTSMATVGLVPHDGGRLETATATLERELTRLFVVPWVAATIVTVLALILAVAVAALQHTRKHQTLLYEEPAGLLAYAGLLEGSELIEVARRARDSEEFDGKVVAAVLRNCHCNKPIRGGEGDVVRDRWKMSPTRGIKPRVIVVETANGNVADRVKSDCYVHSVVPGRPQDDPA